MAANASAGVDVPRGRGRRGQRRVPDVDLAGDRQRARVALAGRVGDGVPSTTQSGVGPGQSAGAAPPAVVAVDRRRRRRGRPPRRCASAGRRRPRSPTAPPSAAQTTSGSSQLATATGASGRRQGVAPDPGQPPYLGVAVELVAAEVEQHDRAWMHRVASPAAGTARRPRARRPARVRSPPSAAVSPVGRLAPPLLLTTAPRVASAATSSVRVVVLPFVPLTSASERPAAAAGQVPPGRGARVTRPPMVVPSPRPVSRDSPAARLPADRATAKRVAVTP